MPHGFRGPSARCARSEDPPVRHRDGGPAHDLRDVGRDVELDPRDREGASDPRPRAAGRAVRVGIRRVEARRAGPAGRDPGRRSRRDRGATSAGSGIRGRAALRHR